MAKELKDVQQLVNDKADSKLKSDLSALQKSIYSGVQYELLKGITLNVGTAEKPKNISLYSIFSSDGFEAKIIENNTERYRATEAQLFLSKVESLREDVDNLLDGRNYE